MPWAPALIQFNLNQMCAFGVSVWSVFAGGKKKREQSPNKLIFLTLTVASVLLPSPKSRIFTWQWNWEKKELGSPLCFLGSCLWLQKCIIMNNINLVVSLACFDSSLICKVPWWCSIALCIDKLFSCFIRQAIGSKMEYTKSFYCCVELIKKEVIKYNNVFFFSFLISVSAVGDSSSLTTDETSMGSNESMSSQSSSASASEMPTERSDHAPLSTSLSSGSNSKWVVHYD